MPLQKGSSKAAIAANVATLRREGYPEDQAVAIALRTAGKSHNPAKSRAKAREIVAAGGCGGGKRKVAFCAAPRKRSSATNPLVIAYPRGQIVMLGWLTELDDLSWPVNAAPMLAYDTRGRLFIVYPETPAGRATPRERASYARTHWGAPGQGKATEGVIAEGPFKALPASKSITYTTKKGSDGEQVDYVHAWGEGGRGAFTPPTVVAHVCQNGRKCPGWRRIALIGGTYRVTERGIVG